jgi:hypothetical protein
VAAVAEKTGGKPIEVWFADEARIGQKNKITRRWGSAAHGHPRHAISEPPRPIFSARSVR